jgi:ABC-type uncharacterized transport system substrate-binding protein
MKRRFLLLMIASWASALPNPVFAKDEVLAVLSADLAPFQEALDGFQKALGHPVATVHLAKESLKTSQLPHVIVAFGGKAATQKYPEGTALIYCMAPGTSIPPAMFQGRVTQVSMMPDPSSTLKQLKRIQPGLKHLAVLWASPADERYIKQLQRAEQEVGIIISADRLEKPEKLPERLRDLPTRAEAIWIPSDPLVINEQNLILLTQFSQEAHIPFYGAIAGLTERGASATLSSNYGEIGRTAARVVQSALDGKAIPEEIYPSQSEMALNLDKATKAGLTIAQPVIDQAQKVIR